MRYEAMCIYTRLKLLYEISQNHKVQGLVRWAFVQLSCHLHDKTDIISYNGKVECL